MLDNEKARIFGIALTLAVPIALASGRWADRNDRPFLPLVVTAAVSAAGIIGMALETKPDKAKARYLVFGLATTVFLSLHALLGRAHVCTTVTNEHLVCRLLLEQKKK